MANGKFSDGKVQVGQEILKELGIALQFEQQVQRDPTLGDNDAEITPINNLQSLVKKIDRAKLDDILAGMHLQISTEEQISLPPTLESATVHWGKSEADGYSAVTPQTQVAGWYSGGVITRTFGGSASAAAAVDGDLEYVLREGFSGSVPATMHVFFIKGSEADVTGILTKVGASPWPIVRMKSKNVVINGRNNALELSGRIVVSSLVQLSLDGTGVDPRTYVSAVKTGERKDTQLHTKTRSIPPCIHGEIIIGSTGDASASANATIKRETAVLTVYDKDGNVIPTPDVTTDYSMWPTEELTVAVTAAGTFSPASFPATTPAVFPTGTYLTSSSARPFLYGWLQVTAITVEVTEDMV